MPIYQFVVRSGDHADDPDVRWSHVPDEDAARRYGHLLIKDFKGLRGIEWANLGYEGPRKLCIS